MEGGDQFFHVKEESLCLEEESMVGLLLGGFLEKRGEGVYGWVGLGLIKKLAHGCCNKAYSLILLEKINLILLYNILSHTKSKHTNKL